MILMMLYKLQYYFQELMDYFQKRFKLIVLFELKIIQRLVVFNCLDR